MNHKTIKAATTTTDQGSFTAIAATYSVDRGNEQIRQGAFADTIAKWQASGKMIPLHWDHSGDAKDIIGTVDPESLREADEGLYVRGQLDIQDSEVAREAWRLMKGNAVSLSFGYLAGIEEKNDAGVLELADLDVFEISITPAPMNPDTRILSTKGVTVTASNTTDGNTGVTVFPSTTTVPTFPNATWTVSSPDPRDAEIARLKARVAELETKADPATEPDEEAIEEAEADEPHGVKPAAQDSLSTRHDDLAYELAVRGIDRREPEEVEEPEGPSLDDLERKHHDLMFQLLTGSED